MVGLDAGLGSIYGFGWDKRIDTLVKQSVNGVVDMGLGLVGWFWMGDGVEEAWCGAGFLTRCCFAGVYVYSTP